MFYVICHAYSFPTTFLLVIKHESIKTPYTPEFNSKCSIYQYLMSKSLDYASLIVSGKKNLMNIWFFHLGSLLKLSN
jgi:hypothetical protein